MCFACIYETKASFIAGSLKRGYHPRSCGDSPRALVPESIGTPLTTTLVERKLRRQGQHDTQTSTSTPEIEVSGLVKFVVLRATLRRGRLGAVDGSGDVFVIGREAIVRGRHDCEIEVSGLGRSNGGGGRVRSGRKQ